MKWKTVTGIKKKKKKMNHRKENENLKKIMETKREIKPMQLKWGGKRTRKVSDVKEKAPRKYYEGKAKKNI